MAQTRQLVASLLVGLGIVAVVVAITAARLGTTSIAEREAEEERMEQRIELEEERREAEEERREEGG